MRDIDTIYHNNFGIAFRWVTETSKPNKKIQLVFRDMGFMLSKNELLLFAENIKGASNLDSYCECEHQQCRDLLLETPLSQLSLAINHEELNVLYDLVQGTLFKLNLEGYLNGICEN